MAGVGQSKRNMRLALARTLQAMLDDKTVTRTEQETLAIADRIIKLTGGKLPRKKKAKQSIFR